MAEQTPSLVNHLETVTIRLPIGHVDGALFRKAARMTAMPRRLTIYSWILPGPAIVAIFAVTPWTLQNRSFDLAAFRNTTDCERAAR